LIIAKKIMTSKTAKIGYGVCVKRAYRGSFWKKSKQNNDNIVNIDEFSKLKNETHWKP